MALGRRTDKQTELFVPVTQLPKSPAHPFYSRLNAVLAQAGFDAFVEQLCEPYYKEGGRPSIPPGTCFRRLFIGYFEGIDSQRGIAWRCADSRSWRAFLGADLTAATPAHNSMTVIRQRLPENIFEGVFAHVLGVLSQKGLLKGKTLGIDATTLEANAAMRSIVRKADGKDWKAFLRRLAKAEGIENPTDEELRRIDRGRKDKKVSNEDGESPHEAIVAAHVTHADRGDAQTGPDTLIMAQAHLVQSGSTAEVREVVEDKGYHDNAFLAWCVGWGLRTYIPQRKQKTRIWTDKPEEYQAAFRANRRRVRGDKGRRLNRWRSERCERSFAHVCETGGGRRMWLRGVVNASKSHLMRCCAYNLGLLLRKRFGLAKPRSGAAVAGLLLVSSALIRAVTTNSPHTAMTVGIAASIILLFPLMLTSASQAQRLR